MTGNGAVNAPRRITRRAGRPTRRRGAELEVALLAAARDELTDVGYAALTMEGVAARAKTSRAVLCRRWPNSPELIVAALRHHTVLAPLEVPNTGTLREDHLVWHRCPTPPSSKSWTKSSCPSSAPKKAESEPAAHDRVPVGSP